MKHRTIAQIRARQYDLTEMSLLGKAIGTLLRELEGAELEHLLDEACLGELAEGESMEMTTEAEISLRDGRLVLAWDESEASGLEGTRTEISFDPRHPALLHLNRSGQVTLDLILEAGCRHLCTYQTPYLPFELCVVTRQAENSLTPWGGRLSLDYLLEIKGAAVQRMCLEVELRQLPDDAADRF